MKRMKTRVLAMVIGAVLVIALVTGVAITGFASKGQCSSNSACGTDGWTGAASCGVDGNVHQNWIVYTCINPGKPTSKCTNMVQDRIKQTCSPGGCQNGACCTIACSSNSACGTDGWTGAASCGADGNVHQNWKAYTCNSAGTCSSSCSSSDTDKVKQTCTSGCTNGICNTINPNSCTDTDGGFVTTVQGTISGYQNNSAYSYTDYCVDSRILKEYYCSGSIYYSYNAGCNSTINSSCSMGKCI